MANDYPICLNCLKDFIKQIHGGYVRYLPHLGEKCTECGKHADLEVRVTNDGVQTLPLAGDL